MNVRNGKKNHQWCMWLRAGSLVNRGDSERQREIQNRWKMLAGSMQGTSIINKWGKVIQEMETVWRVWMPIVQILIRIRAEKGLPRWHSGKESACKAGDVGSIPGLEGHLEEDMATHSSILAWRSPWTEEPGGLQFMCALSMHTLWLWNICKFHNITWGPIIS